MALEKIYTPIGWQNKPSTATPLGSHNLSKIDEALVEIDERVVELSEDTEELDRRVEEAETDITKNADDITTLENRFTGFSTAMSQGMQVLSDRVDEAEAKIEKNTEDISALKIIPTASGNTAYMDDASNMNIENIVFYGESKQMQTTGKNKIDSSGFVTKTSNGITFTPKFDSNGNLEYITANGTATADSYYTIIEKTNVPQEALVLNGCEGGSASTYSLLTTYRNEDDTYADQAFQSQTNTDLLIDTSKKIYSVTIFVKSGATVNNVRIYPMLRPKGTDATYEPYTGGKASPSPDYPQPIESKTVNRVDVYGKNLLKFSQGSTTSNGITFTVNADKSVTVNGTATADAVLLLTTSTRGEVDLKRLTGKSIILSGCPSGGSGTTYKFQFWSASKWAVDTGNGATLDLSTVPDTWNFAISIISGTTINNLTFYPMIRLPEFTDATYEPYQSQTKSLATGTYRLDGIGDLKNYYDAKRGVYGEKVDRVTFDGSDDEEWYKHDEQYPHLFRTYIKSPAKGLRSVLCSHFPYDEGGLTDGLDGCRFRNEDISIVFYISSSKHTDVSSFRSWLANNPVTLVYELAEPEEGNLIASVKDDFAEFLKLHTYKPNTVLMNGADAEMDVHYVADAKTYIDKKFETLASAIINQ